MIDRLLGRVVPFRVQCLFADLRRTALPARRGRQDYLDNTNYGKGDGSAGCFRGFCRMLEKEPKRGNRSGEKQHGQNQMDPALYLQSPLPTIQLLLQGLGICESFVEFLLPGLVHDDCF